MFLILNYKVFGICLVLQYLQIGYASPVQQNDCQGIEFKCDGKCVNAIWKCSNASDIIRGDCRSQSFAEFQCQNSKECLPYSQICNGLEECKDGSDESMQLCEGHYCPSGSFRCDYGACIAKTAVCNHVFDCRDQSDELDVQCRQLKNISSNGVWMTYGPVTPRAFPSIGVNEKSCKVPQYDKALRLKPMFRGLPYKNDSTVPHQMTVQLSCSQNHVLLGIGINTCDNGEWKAIWAQCVKVCDRKTILLDPSVNVICSHEGQVINCNSDSLFVNTIANVGCAQGYKSNSAVTQGERICNSNGTWVRRFKGAKKLKCIPDCGKTFNTVKEDPWLVSIFRVDAFNNYVFSCLGAIIHPGYVLTAANCFLPNSTSNTAYTIALGRESVGFDAAQEHGYILRTIADIDVITYKPLALLEMVNPLVLTARVRPICLKNYYGAAIRTNNETLGEPLIKLEAEHYLLTHIFDKSGPISVNDFAVKFQELLKNLQIKSNH